MKIKATESFATISDSYEPGETYDVAVALGKQWIAAGWASEVKPSKATKRKSKKVI